MTKTTMTAVIAVSMLSLSIGAVPAGAAETVRYRVAMDLEGSWSETVRADLDEGDGDHDGTENVASRDSTIRFALKATMPDVPLRDGRVAKPLYDVAQTSLTQDVVSSTYTDFYGTSGACSPQNQGATGGGTIASAGSALVFRPSSDAVLDLVCVDPYARWSMSVDLLRVAASNVVPELGQAPLDVAFAIPAKRFGDRRITIPVAASDAQRAFERCPREDPGHTVACPFVWKGTVSLDRLTPEIGRARLSADGVTAQVDVRCATACEPTLRAGASRKAYAIPAGVDRKLTLRLGAASRRALRRDGRLRLVVEVGDERRTFTLRNIG
jgi:hypothetical protein